MAHDAVAPVTLAGDACSLVALAKHAAGLRAFVGGAMHAGSIGFSGNSNNPVVTAAAAADARAVVAGTADPRAVVAVTHNTGAIDAATPDARGRGACASLAAHPGTALPRRFSDDSVLVAGAADSGVARTLADHAGSTATRADHAGAGICKSVQSVGVAPVVGRATDTDAVEAGRDPIEGAGEAVRHCARQAERRDEFGRGDLPIADLCRAHGAIREVVHGDGPIGDLRGGDGVGRQLRCGDGARRELRAADGPIGDAAGEERKRRRGQGLARCQRLIRTSRGRTAYSDLQPAIVP